MLKTNKIMFAKFLNKFKWKMYKRPKNKRHCKIDKKKIEKCSIIQYIQEELLTSTTHGLPYIINPRIYFFERIFWALSFTGCIVLMILLLSAQYKRYIESPTVMSVEMNYFDWNISYPAITLCPLHKTDIALYNSLVEETFRRTGLKTDTFFWGIASGGMDNLNIIYLNIAENVSALVHPKNYSRLAAEIFRKFPTNGLTTNTNWTISLETAMTEVGMCHVINSNVAIYDNPFKWAEKEHEYAKTNVELTIYEGDFMTLITNYAMNYKVYIHHPDELVLSTSPSFTFDIEGLVKFGLSVWSTRISEELRPRSIALRKCRFVNEPLNKRYPVYSYNHCILECKIRVILQLCGCVPHFYKPLVTERVCKINELNCVLKFKKEILSLAFTDRIFKSFPYKLPKSSRDCGCLSNCETDIYFKDDEVFTFKESIGQLQIGITTFPKIRVVRDIIFNLYDILSFASQNFFKSAPNPDIACTVFEVPLLDSGLSPMTGDLENSTTPLQCGFVDDIVAPGHFIDTDNLLLIKVRSGGVVNLFIGSSIISIMELIVLTIKLFVYGIKQLYRNV